MMDQWLAFCLSLLPLSMQLKCAYSSFLVLFGQPYSRRREEEAEPNGLSWVTCFGSAFALLLLEWCYSAIKGANRLPKRADGNSKPPPEHADDALGGTPLQNAVTLFGNCLLQAIRREFHFDFLTKFFLEVFRRSTALWL